MVKGVEQIGGDKYKILIGHTTVKGVIMLLYKEVTFNQLIEETKNILKTTDTSKYIEVREHIKSYEK